MKYTINVVRDGVRGRVIFSHGAVEVNTECWWDPKVVIDSGTYVGYATRMDNKHDGRGGKKREAIWFGKKIPVNRFKRYAKGIFMHKGTDAGWSDGCVVCENSEILKIWDAVAQKDMPNIEVNVYNIGGKVRIEDYKP
jgi:hypothetical protein